MARAAATHALTPRGATTVSRHDAGSPGAGRCLLHCANNDPVREILLAIGFSRQYGVLGPGTTMSHSSMKSQGESTMAPAQKCRLVLNGMRRLTSCGHKECTFSTKFMRRPIPKHASFNDGP
ncbi:hypothetical protein TcCL_NonESM07686 [Trypanosoma cruzi]|nr:hypothetical protein TcCL_NonESM07686 [Trypanosoma cruzi]